MVQRWMIFVTPFFLFSKYTRCIYLLKKRPLLLKNYICILSIDLIQAQIKRALECSFFYRV